MGIEKSKSLVPLIHAGTGSDQLAEDVLRKARLTVACREEMSLSERRDMLEMLGLAPGSGDEVDMSKDVDVQQWNSAHGRM